jgi:hypothetical protein
MAKVEGVESRLFSGQNRSGLFACYLPLKFFKKYKIYILLIISNASNLFINCKSESKIAKYLFYVFQASLKNKN